MKTLTRIQGITHNILGVMSIKDSCLLTCISVLQLIILTGRVIEARISIPQT